MHATPTSHHGIDAIRIDGHGATAIIALQGAQVLSWCPANGREQLFLARSAPHAPGMAIRGGVPVIFPQFSERGPLPRHGFARTRPWRFEGIDAGHAVFALDDSGLGDLWPHAFIARLQVALSASQLSLTLDIGNRGDTTFIFTAALHTYLRVADLTQASLTGLQGCDYEDSAAGGTLHREHDYSIAFDDGEIDRIYGDVVAPLELSDGEHTLSIEHDGFGDAVVWNPGAALAASIGDLAPGEHREFVCVEAGQILQPVVLMPGEHWRGSQTLG